MTDTSFKPNRDCQQRIAWRRIASLSAALSALALMAGICSLRPRWQQEIGRLPINLGTAQMQAEAEAPGDRPAPPLHHPPPPTAYPPSPRVPPPPSVAAPRRAPPPVARLMAPPHTPR
ncbi:hypothetical protein DI494_21855, partial [Stenotrophomonas maltophilia]